ncbi:non-ribosomal peptide synthetase [Microcoleus sp. OTE_8_concoct_300]|uniref:non-ribosomal peptide synthetase n=1 Tax=Microcoleus sp. OTE_8_concoct_300 TaxID=2964710 RepID=UPI00403F1789
MKACEYVPLSKDLTQSCYIHKFTLVEDKLTMQGNSSLEKQPQLTGDSPSFPLSHGQQAIWFLYQMAPQSVAYNIYTTVRISSSLDLGAWHRAWLRIVERHQALRTTYTKRDGQPVQVVHLYQEVDVKVTDASSWSDDYLKKQILAEAECPYNLETGPVLRVHLFTRSAVEHIQLLAMHHIAGDMWSFDILLSELRVLYAAEVKTLPPSSIHIVENSDISNSQRDNNIRALPNLPYRDYVRWQTEMLASSKGEQLAAYWQKQLAGELPLLNLPIDKPRPREQTYCGANHIIELDKELLQELRQLSETEGTSLYRILLAAFFVLLYRYTGQEDIPVGSPMAGRWGREEFQGIVGFFTSPVVCRANLAGNPTFKEFLAQVSRTVSEASEHQDYPFPLLVKELSPNRYLSCHPLFQVSLTSQKHRWYDQAQKSPLKQEKTLLAMSPYLIEGHQRGAALDLNLAIIEAGSSFQLCWQYNTDLFDISTVHRMASSYQTLLKSILTNPEERVSSLPLLTQGERSQLLVEWNDTKVEYPFDKCIHQLFEEQVERSPDAEAVLFEDKQLTYRELNQRANCLAHHLRTLGVRPEVLVGICVERSLEMVVGLLGILKAGGAYVPLDPAYPPERLAFMLEDAQVGVLLTQARLVESLPKHQGSIVCLDTDWEIIERQSKENPECSFTPENLAYVIYTSGSTGKPKGVLVAHSGVSNLATALIRSSNVQPKSRVLQFCSLSFDGSVTELVMALLSGATMVMGTRDSLLPGANLIQLLRDFRITTVALLPSVLAVLPANELPALRTVIAAGEACSRELVAKWSSGRQFFNGYGPTECTVCTTIVECTDSKEAPPIGRPLPNTQVYILDAQKQLVPIGVPGELYIGGVGVTRGYLNRPELTAERFILNPFSNDSGSRLYKTGDLARYLPDGNIEYLGRIDHQVKIRGFRIELGEIEAMLRQHRAVQDAVVIGLEYDLHDHRLVAYVVPSHEQVLSTSELRHYLKEKLPDHMVPSAFVRLEALPLTPNDKVDRRALPMPDGTRSVEENFAPPLTPFEEVLAGIWREVLRLDSVGIHDNFFELGGHSLLAVRLLAQIEKTFGKNLPLATLFQSPTIEQLAKILHQSAWSSPWFSLVPIQPSGSQPPFFGIHSLGKGQEHYRNIARHLGSDQPIYGLDYWLATQTKDRKQALNTWRVEELAAHYIKEMRILQPEGPYFLAGFSFGGIVAYEMAQQLVTQGQKVALLVLFDTRCPALSLKSIDFNTFQIHLKKLSQLEMKEKLAYIRSKVKYKIQQNLKWIKPFFLKVAEKFYLKFKLPMPYALHYSLIVEANNKLASDYALQVYPGQVTLFRTTDQAVRYDQCSDLGWSALALGGVEIHEVPGNHLDMLKEPHVQVLAKKLKACIDRVQAEELAHIPPLCSNPFVCDNEDSEVYHIQARSGLR